LDELGNEWGGKMRSAAGTEKNEETQTRGDPEVERDSRGKGDKNQRKSLSIRRSKRSREVTKN